MESFSLILAIVVVTALAFDFTNGFHDTANAMATTISTGALKPKVAVAMSAVLNLVGAFLSVEVANTISKGLVDETGIRPEVIFAALVGAILWNLLTWLVGLPSSLLARPHGRSDRCRGRLGGRRCGQRRRTRHQGADPGDRSPARRGLAALLGARLTYKLGRKADGKAAAKGYRAGQIASAGLVSLAHGTNDAQKTMGIITLALVAGGPLAPRLRPAHVGHPLRGIAIALGTYLGGWRIIRTMGKGPTDLQPQQGFAAQTSAATVILASLPPRLLPLHHALGLRRGDGRGPRPQGRRGALVHGHPDVRRLGPDPAGRGLVAAIAEWVCGLGDWGTALVAVFLVASSAAIWKLSRREIVDHTNVVDEPEEAGVVTTAMAAVSPPPAGVTEDLAAAGAPGSASDSSGPRPPPPSEPAPWVRRKANSMSIDWAVSAPSSGSACGHRGPGGPVHPRHRRPLRQERAAAQGGSAALAVTGAYACFAPARPRRTAST